MQISARVEAVIHTKRFNHLGGLLLDRQVRSIISSLADSTQRSVRDKFLNLSQLSMILSLDTLNEITEFWTDNIVSQQSNSLTLESVLEMRTDLGN